MQAGASWFHESSPWFPCLSAWTCCLCSLLRHLLSLMTNLNMKSTGSLIPSNPRSNFFVSLDPLHLPIPLEHSVSISYADCEGESGRGIYAILIEGDALSILRWTMLIEDLRVRLRKRIFCYMNIKLTFHIVENELDTFEIWKKIGGARLTPPAAAVADRTAFRRIFLPRCLSRLTRSLFSASEPPSIYICWRGYRCCWSGEESCSGDGCRGGDGCCGDGDGVGLIRKAVLRSLGNLPSLRHCFLLATAKLVWSRHHNSSYSFHKLSICDDVGRTSLPIPPHLGTSISNRVMQLHRLMQHATGIPST